MKENFENSSIDIEQLLRTKNWNQLSPAEQEELKNVLSGREEYERMYAMVHQLKTVTGVHDTDLVPSSGLRENLLTAFEDEQRKRRAMWWSGLWYRIGSSLRFDIPAVRIGFAAVLLVVGVLTVFNLMNKDESAPVIAKEENVQRAPEAPKENPVSDNNITVQPEQIENQNPSVPQNVIDQNDQTVPAPVNNGMQVVDGNAPVVPDSNAKVFAMNPVDSSLQVVAPLTFNVTNGGSLCCATSNGTIVTTGTAGANYTWTNSGSNTLNVAGATNGTVNIVTVNGLPPRARALSNDAQVLDVFFEVK